MNGIEKLHPQNHDLYRRVTHLLNLQWKWEAIAQDVGIYQINDIVDWYLEYKSPKPLPMVNSMVLNVPVRSQALLDRGVRLSAWQRQRDGARKALEAAGL